MIFESVTSRLSGGGAAHKPPLRALLAALPLWPLALCPCALAGSPCLKKDHETDEAAIRLGEHAQTRDSAVILPMCQARRTGVCRLSGTAAAPRCWCGGVTLPILPLAFLHGAFSWGPSRALEPSRHRHVLRQLATEIAPRSRQLATDSAPLPKHSGRLSVCCRV